MDARGWIQPRVPVLSRAAGADVLEGVSHRRAPRLGEVALETDGPGEAGLDAGVLRSRRIRGPHRAAQGIQGAAQADAGSAAPANRPDQGAYARDGPGRDRGAGSGK